MIKRRFSCEARMSTPIESTPWGFVSKNSFINVGICFQSDVTPQDMLNILHGIELEMGCTTHRNADGSYTDRLIDIDIIAIDDMVIKTPTLTVPHPHIAQRDFVLIPMAELAPYWKHPILHKTAQQLLQELTPSL